MKGRYARYNEQKNCVDVTVYEAGYILRLDCGKLELRPLQIHKGG